VNFWREEKEREDKKNYHSETPCEFGRDSIIY
jgi:hypothetical protein